MAYPNANEIIPRIWIGDVRSSEDWIFLANKNIEVIVNCTRNLPHRFEPKSTKEIPQEIIDNYFIKYFRVPCDDNGRETENDEFLQGTLQVIDRVIELYYAKKNILVHCAAGQQRSCSFVFCLLHRLGYTKDLAFQEICKKREAAFNFGYEIHFKKALDDFK